MIRHVRYDIDSAFINHGIEKHPQLQMKELGFKLIKSEPVSIADCWWFRVEDGPEILPDYITLLSDNFKFSDEH